MNKTRSELKEERLQKLFSDCQQTVLSQIIGPFGLSTAMFDDKNGGNVTTLHNFSRDDDEYVATNNDKVLHKKSKEVYGNEIRKDYELKTKKSAGGGKTWQQKRDDKIKNGVDEYTGKTVSVDGNGDATVTLSNGTVTSVELDHVVSINKVHNDPKMHLALGQVKDGKADVSKIRDVVNNENNLALTNEKLNASKREADLKDWMKKQRGDGAEAQSNAQAFEVNENRANAVYKKATDYINSTANVALLKKQTTELMRTGGTQAAQMGIRQALGVLLTELVNGLFNEFKILIRHGVEAGKTLFQEITQRLKRVAVSVAKKVPDALSQGVQGGVSGFVSNLLTFLINNFLSTAKRFVTAIREVLLSLYRAFKMIFFPPEHMTSDQALQEGIKILTLAVTTTCGILLQETVKAFVATVPFLTPIADVVSSVLVGIVTGLLSAFLAYQIDCFFDRLRNSHDERMMDQLMADAKGQEEFANGLVLLAESSLNNVRLYSTSIALYDEIGESLRGAETSSRATLDSLQNMVAETQDQVKENQETLKLIDASNAIVTDFLDGN